MAKMMITINQEEKRTLTGINSIGIGDSEIYVIEALGKPDRKNQPGMATIGGFTEVKPEALTVWLVWTMVKWQQYIQMVKTGNIRV